jgi:site-specific DNA-methyltransferase (adenine-specific)
LGRNYLGLETDEAFLEMSRNRRLELEDLSLRENYLNRLRKANIIPPDDAACCVAEAEMLGYGVPWFADEIC